MLFRSMLSSPANVLKKSDSLATRLHQSLIQNWHLRHRNFDTNPRGLRNQQSHGQFENARSHCMWSNLTNNSNRSIEFNKIDRQSGWEYKKTKKKSAAQILNEILLNRLMGWLFTTGRHLDVWLLASSGADSGQGAISAKIFEMWSSFNH